VTAGPAGRAGGLQPGRRPPGRRGGSDDGLTLIDMVVSMVIMSIFMSMFTTAILQTYHAANKIESISGAQSQIHTAFLRLDKEIRYAAGISTESSTGDPYVEYLTTNTGSPVCTELRLDVASRQLQRRTWPQGMSPLTPSNWIPLATEISSVKPFTFTAADSTFNFQRLRLQLAASSGGASTATTKQTDITFTALNTSLGTASATVCTEGRLVA
jgi:type II secretory pathway pseudopilin PulG